MQLIFYNTDFKPEQNAVYEDVETFLQRLTPVRTLTNVKTFGYFDLQESLRLPMSSHDNQFNGVTNIGDYVKVIDDAAETPAIYYYFVRGFSWKAANTVELDLYMDTATTYWKEIQTNLAPTTHVTRKMKRRWQVPTSTSTVLYPIVDKFAEPFQVAFKQTSDTTIYDKYTPYLGKWYLVWSSKVFDVAASTTKDTNITPSAYLLIPERQKTVTIKPSTYSTITTGNIPCGNLGWFAVGNEQSPKGIISLTSTGGVEYTIDLSEEGMWVVIALKDDLLIVQKRYTNSTGGGEYLTKSITLSNIDVIYRQTSTYPWMSTAYNYGDLVYTNPLNTNDSYISTYWYPFKLWYRRNSTDDSIVKIYEFPYCPITLNISENNDIIIDPTVNSFDSNLMVLNPDVEWKHELMSIMYPVSGITKAKVQASIQAHYAPQFETKLLNSNYGGYTTYAYDANSWMVRPELMTFNGTQTLVVNQLVSPQSGGVTFTFTSDQQRLDSDDWFISSNRINELPAFNSDYVEYLKYGNAIEQKRLNATAAQGVVTGVTTAASIGGAITLAAKGAATAGWRGAIIGGAIGVLTATVNISTQMSQQTEQMLAGKRQMSNSASRASAINDLEIYNNLGYQCLRELTYEPVTTNEPILDYFHLYGYATDYNGVPTFNVRYWFDYVQCEPAFRRRFTWKDREEDIAARMKEGLTIYHLHNGVYDINKEYENWEADVYRWSIN